ncbi:MAG: hypothetical protein R3208_14495 [Ketobacteraceae bacterium]|nr:hypothetical protein [Ketobacteraceae bacterium]
MSWQDVLSQLDYEPALTPLDDLLQNRPSSLLYPLAQFSCLAIEGPERFSFLQGQVTCDMKRVEEGEPLLGAHLNLQGRIEAGFILFPAEDRILMLIPTEQVPHLKPLLQKYLLFAKAELSEADDILAYLDWPASPAGNAAGFELAQSNNLFVRLVPVADTESLLKKAQVARQEEALAVLHRNGLFLVDEPHRGAFLPQELNYDQMDGISFNKGCYKGQEVVARIHFKGQVKQRLTAFHCASPCEAGSAVLNAEGKKCGEILHQSPIAHGSIGCALIKTADWESKRLFLEQNDGPELQLLPPPYAIT